MPGALELLPPHQVAFQRMLDTIRAAYERFGFVPVETPAIELAELLLTKSGGETERQVYFVQSAGSLEQGERPDLALRFDLTVPLARYVAEHQHQLTFPFRRYQIQRVYRGERPQRGRFREFYQCDVDVVDRDDLSLRHDAEVLAMVAAVFTELAIGSFSIRLNHRRLMRGLLESLGVGDPGSQTMVLRAIDKLGRRGHEAVARSLTELGMTPAETGRLLGLAATATTSHQEAVDVLQGLAVEHPPAKAGAAELAEVLDGMAAMGMSESEYALDLSVARGLDYYTGAVAETVLSEHPEIGSICSGGRYADLAGHYTDSRLPGVGMSIGLTRLFWQLDQLGLIDPASSVEAVVTLMDGEGLSYALDVARRLRLGGINTQAVLEPAKLGSQLKSAARAGARFALIAGADERSRGTVTVRDLATGDQQELARDAAAAHLASRG